MKLIPVQVNDREYLCPTWATFIGVDRNGVIRAFYTKPKYSAKRRCWIDVSNNDAQLTSIQIGLTEECDHKLITLPKYLEPGSLEWAISILERFEYSKRGGLDFVNSGPPIEDFDAAMNIIKALQ